jgi:hydrogenase expression/formation protein HypD
VAIRLLVVQLEEGRAEVENQYARSVSLAGNLPARRIMEQVFEVAGRNWRGIGPIAASGLRIREEFAAFDAARIFDTGDIATAEPAECISAMVLQGLRKPADCPAFDTPCTPESPLGAPMVSSEGVCAAYYAYRRHVPEVTR